MSPVDAEQLAAGIAGEFRTHMRDEYVPRIGRCVELLDAGELWQRPGSHGNSVANLLLHLEGNVRQWILAGIGGVADHRDRDGEFAAAAETREQTGAEMMSALTRTVDEAVAVVDALTATQLLEVRTFQSRYDQTCLAAVLHVLEHFSGHAGQIYAFTKQVKDIDLKFWDL